MCNNLQKRTLELNIDARKWAKTFIFILTAVNSNSLLLLHEKQTNIQKEKTEVSMTFGKFNTIPTSLLVYTLAKFLWSLNHT